MKFCLFFASVAFLTFFCFGQNAKISSDNDIVSNPEVQAQFPGGNTELLHYLTQNLKFQTCNDEEIGSKIIVKFVVKKDGTIEHPVVTQCFQNCQSCRDEIIRVILAMPKWTPGKSKGEIVNSYYQLVTHIDLLEHYEPDLGFSTETESLAVDDDIGPEPYIPSETEIDTNQIYTFVDESAEFPGGTKELLNFIHTNFKYPEIAKTEEIQGKCYVRFTVNKDGTISNIVILRGIIGCPECDKEAIRLVKTMPKWTPGKIQGKFVNSYYALPLIFKID